MQIFDMHHNIIPITVLGRTNIAGAGNIDGAIIDTVSSQSLEFLFHVQDLDAGTSSTITLLHGDDPALSDAEEVSEEEILGGPFLLPGPISADIVFKLGYIGKKRYVMLRIVTTAEAGQNRVMCLAVLGTISTQPTENQTTV